MVFQDFWRQHPEGLETMLREALVRVDKSRESDVRIALAWALMLQTRFAEAREIVTTTLAEKPEHSIAQWSETVLAFFMNDPWPGPWRKLECRWAAGITEGPPKIVRQWDGSPLNGKTILVVGEGGLGDEIQFVRFVSTLKDRGASKVFVCTKSSLISIFESVAGIDGVLAESEPRPHYSCDCSLMSLPGLLGTTLETLPTAPYLSVPDDLVGAVRRRIQTRSGELKVGLFWRSNRPDKTIPLPAFSPLAQVSNVRLFGLGEKSILEKEISGSPFEILNLGSDKKDVLPTAAAISALDLIISVDSMGAHLAGSLGRPVWLMVHAFPDWRWPISGETTPWYPTMRIFRQRGAGWDSVIQDMALELSKLRSGRLRDAEQGQFVV
jgi:hypothetical protein